MLAAAAVIVVLGLGAAGMKFFGGAAADAGAADPATVTAPPSSEKTDVASAADSARGPAEQFGAELGQRVPDAGSVQPVGGAPNRPANTPANTPATSGPGTGPAGTSRAPRGSASVPDVLQRVTVLNGAFDPGKARESIALLNTIGGSLVKGSEDHIWAQLLRAEAYAVLDQQQNVCTTLLTIQGRSDDVTRNRRIDAFRETCP